jgi:hypothetical protein
MRPWDCVSSFREFVQAPEEAKFYSHMQTPPVQDLYSQVHGGLGAKAQLFHEGDNLTLWPDGGGFIRLKPDGTWEMDIAPFAG